MNNLLKRINISFIFCWKEFYDIKSTVHETTRRKCYIERLDTRVIKSIYLMYFTQSRHDYILRKRGCLTSHIYVNELT